MTTYKLTGGARIGMANATYPFAKLIVNKNKLELNASVIGVLVFAPVDIVSIEPYEQMALLGQGIKINHVVKDYNEKVIFWTNKNPKEVINEIKKTGFLDKNNSPDLKPDPIIRAQQKQGGLPIKKSALITLFVAWNLLFLSDFYRFFTNPEAKGLPIGVGVKSAVALIFLTCALTLVVEPFRSLILKEGRKIEDVKSILLFVMGITAFMFLGFSMVA